MERSYLILSDCLQEKGLAKAMLTELGLEMVARVDRPARAGNRLNITCTHVDVASGAVHLLDSPTAGQQTGLPLAIEGGEGEGAGTDGGGLQLEQEVV